MTITVQTHVDKLFYLSEPQLSLLQCGNNEYRSDGDDYEGGPGSYPRSRALSGVRIHATVKDHVPVETLGATCHHSVQPCRGLSLCSQVSQGRWEAAGAGM